jgi:cobalt-zinc-cadmium resistance protein CzcA
MEFSDLRWGRSRPDLGEVFHYVLIYDGVDFSKVSQEERIKRFTELRTIHDWIVKPQLRSVRGVAEVNSWGGYEKQYQISDSIPNGYSNSA